MLVDIGTTKADCAHILGPQLRTVSTMSVGMDHIDTEECMRRGVTIGNTPVYYRGWILSTFQLLRLHFTLTNVWILTIHVSFLPIMHVRTGRPD